MTVIRDFVIALLAFAVFMPLNGCSSSPSPEKSDIRQARLWAEENLKLKANVEKLQSQLTAQQKELDRSKDKCGKETQELQAKCEKEKQQMQKDAEETTSFLMEKLPTDMLKQVEDLQKENEALKQQLSPKN